MNAILFLVRTPIAKALGWALVHSLWQGALIAALVAAGFLLLRPASARARYALACAGMLAMLAAFAITLAILWPAPAAPIVLPPPSALRAAPPGPIAFPAPPVAPPDRLPWIVPFWMLGVFAFYLRTAGGWLAAQRLRTRGTIPAPAEWQDRLRSLAARLRITRPVALLESCLAETPVLIGYLRPAILIPAGLLAGLAPDQLEAILLHELAHIRRHDYAVNVMQTLIEGLLFYHPAVWWLSSVVRAERENCCDDAVVAERGDAVSYAAALAALEARRAVTQPALAATGGNLMKRIRRLLEPNRPRSVAGPVLAAILLLAPLAVALSAWPAKPQAPASTPAPPPVPVTRQSPPLVLVAQVQPQQTTTPSLATPYRKWLDEDVAYIITDEERDAFNGLTTDDERENFIEQFWKKRDPTPGTPENEFKEEHYRRIAYANDHFPSASAPGWKTDRGRIYIMYGPPDEIDAHRAGQTAADAYPFQQWTYRYTVGVGNPVTFDFVDTAGTGEFRMTMSLRDAQLATLDAEIANMEKALAALKAEHTEDHPTVRSTELMLKLLQESRRNTALQAESTAGASSPAPDLAFHVSVAPFAPSASSALVTFSVPLNPADGIVNVFWRVTTQARRMVNADSDRVDTKSLSPGEPYRQIIPLPPGSYRVDIIVKNQQTGAHHTGQQEFEVKQ